jgi:hypothetical protein
MPPPHAAHHAAPAHPSPLALPALAPSAGTAAAAAAAAATTDPFVLLLQDLLAGMHDYFADDALVYADPACAHPLYLRLTERLYDRIDKDLDLDERGHRQLMDTWRDQLIGLLADAYCAAVAPAAVAGPPGPLAAGWVLHWHRETGLSQLGRAPPPLQSEFRMDWDAERQAVRFARLNWLFPKI